MKPSIVSVTPAMAAEWLTRNRGNREVDTGAVKRYADAMLGGRWRLADQSVKFKIGGDLLDGQHRLMAVVRSGVAVPMLVLTDVEHWTVWHPGGANHLSSEWCYTCDLERAVAELRAEASGQEGDPDCECAMTEASMRTCPLHGEDGWRTSGQADL